MRRVLVIATLLLLAAPLRADDLFSNLDAVRAQLKGGDSVERRDAVDKLDAFSSAEAQPLVLRALADGDSEVRAHAAAAAGRRKLTAAVPALTQALGDADSKLRAAAAEALGQALSGPGAADPSPEARRAVDALERALGDGEHDVREAAVVALGRLPTALGKRAAVALTGRLDDDAAGVRQHAAEVLGRMGEARAVVPLLARLGDTTREVRGAAIEALALLGDARAVPAIVRLLRDPADEVRATAVTALGRLKVSAATGALVETMAHGQPESLRARAAFALGQLASAPGGQAAAAALMTALGRDELQAAAGEALVRAGRAAAPALIAELPDAPLDRAALDVELLRQIGDERATPVLLDELARARLNEESLVDALGAMLRAGDKRPLVELVARLQAPTPSLRRHAAAALAGVTDARAVDSLQQALGDSERPVRLMALAELGRLDARAALPAIAHTLLSNDEETAAAAARTLGQLGDARAVQPLVAALGRGGRKLRREAADALGRIADPNAAPVLLRAVRSSAPDRRASAIVALGGVLRHHPEGNARELLLGYAEGGDAAAALASVDALAALGDAQAVPRLVHLLDGRADRDLRLRILGALGALDSDEATRALTTMLTADVEPRLRAEAAWALGKKPRAAAASERVLTDALASPDGPLRANAAAALFRLQRAPRALERLLDDRDPAARANAALALAHTPSARPAIARLADHDDDRLARAAAQRALGGANPAAGSDWIALDVVDFDGAALGDARYRLALPDGTIKSGVTDERGLVAEEAIPSGACTLVLDEAVASR